MSLLQVTSMFTSFNKRCSFRKFIKNRPICDKSPNLDTPSVPKRYLPSLFSLNIASWPFWAEGISLYEATAWTGMVGKNQFHQIIMQNFPTLSLKDIYVAITKTFSTCWTFFVVLATSGRLDFGSSRIKYLPHQNCLHKNLTFE